MESNDVKSGVLTMNVPAIIKGLTELGSLSIEDFTLNLGISEAVAKLNPVEKAYMKSAQALMRSHIEVDEKGIPKTEGEGPYKTYVYKSVSDKQTYLDEMEKLNNTEVKLDLKIKATQLKSIKGLTALTMMKLGALIENDLVAVATE